MSASNSIPKFDDYLSEFLADLRAEAGLTQQEVADHMSLDRTSVARFESGKRAPSDFGYVASLVELFFDKMQHGLEDTEEAQNHLIAELEKVRRGCFAGEPKVEGWEQLLDVANQYRNRHKKLPIKRVNRVDWGEAPAIDDFVGRQSEIEELHRWIVGDKCRLICLLGMGGMGKTALATYVAQQIQDQFDLILWRSVRNAPLYEDFLEDALQFFAEQKDLSLNQNVDSKLRTLIEIFRTHRCLFVIDNIESILQKDPTGQFREQYSGYGELIQQVGSSSHDSCLLLTSREKPANLAKLDGPNAQVRTFSLAGLSEADGEAILSENALVGSSESLPKLVQLYSGNPLALNIVADMIREIYSNDIDDFIEDGVPLFGDIEDVLNEQYARLSTLEQQVLLWLAIEREPVSREVLLGNSEGVVKPRELSIALLSLRRRSLVEAVADLFTLQNVVMEYATGKIVERAKRQILDDNDDILCTHALLKAQSKAYVRHTQERLILSPLVENINQLISHNEVEQRFQSLVVRASDRKTSDYLAGNIINLSITFGITLNTYIPLGLNKGWV